MTTEPDRPTHARSAANPDADRLDELAEHPPYPVGLRLTGRRVVVVGGGHVAQRRVAGLIAAGADVLVVSPVLTPALEGMLAEITWREGRFEPADLDGAWYALATTDDASVNHAVVQAADERRIFCVRADDAREASAWTPATGRHGGVTVAVLGNREPRRSAALRDAIVGALVDGRISTGSTVHSPGVVLVGGGPGDPGLVTVAAPPGARHGRRGGRRPPRAARAARRAGAPRRAGRRRQAAPRPGRQPGGHQRRHRRAGPRGQARRAVQGGRQLRLRARLRGDPGL
ncbi:siroheme synthase (precorrin-2 oxidase/ferrochelatase) [Nocardioides zeae]|uniref:precorrin-2 dehydrogenase n=1 Tax=Nocardioides zeae TaxID=1457234 RepID=A0AAJ1X0P3_9ACTN|nr:siroheme synthase (precorrin-2 oxidase/ferrochelatase) [Nocardioides zeae]